MKPGVSLKSSEFIEGINSWTYSNHDCFTLLFMGCDWSLRIRHNTWNCWSYKNVRLEGARGGGGGGGGGRGGGGGGGGGGGVGGGERVIKGMFDINSHSKAQS